VSDKIIWCFGDSWTEGYGIETEILLNYDFTSLGESENYIKEIRRQNAWPSKLASLIGGTSVNLGNSGDNNHDIQLRVNKCISDNVFSKDDLILIMFSYPYREPPITEDYKARHKNIITIMNELESSLDGYNRFYFNSFWNSFEFEEEYVKYDRFIEPEFNFVNELVKYDNVWEESRNELIIDELKKNPIHPNRKGHDIIAKNIYKKLKKRLV